jgi:hypothetical protein
MHALRWMATLGLALLAVGQASAQVTHGVLFIRGAEMS